MWTSKERNRAAAILVLALFGGMLHAQFADQSVALGINGAFPQSVLNNPQIVLFYWSPTWNASSTYSENQINAAVHLMVFGDGTPPYFQKTSQYTDTAGDSIQPVLNPAFADTSQLNVITNCGYSSPGASVNSLTLTTWIQCMLDGTGSIGFGFPPQIGTPDTLPVFFLPTGSALNNDNLSLALNVLAELDTLGGTGLLEQKFPNGISLPNGCSDFYGYHFWTSPVASNIIAGTVNPFSDPKLRLAYGVIPLACFGNSSSLASDPSGFYTGFDDLTEGVAHELVEGLTDPFLPLGFIDFSQASPLTQGEAGDLCYQGGRVANVWYQNQVVAAYWSNADSACVAGNNTLNTVTLSATFRNDGPATVIPNSVTFQFDVRSGKLKTGGGPNGNNYTFPIQVVKGSTHSFSFPSPLVQNANYQVVSDGANPLQGNGVINANTSDTVNYITQYYVSVLAPALANATPVSGYFNIGNLPITTAATYTDQANKLWQFFNWTGSATVLTNNFTANVNQSLFYQARYVRDVSSAMSFVRSGLTYNRATQLYYGTLTITNTGTEILSNLLPVALTGLPAGVTLANAAGTYKGAPYVLTTTSAGLPPGASNTIPIQFKITGGAVNYGVSLYSFH